MLTLAGVAALLAINLTMVLDSDATAYLKWDFIGKVLADGGSSVSTSTSCTCYLTFTYSAIGLNNSQTVKCTGCEDEKCKTYSDKGTCKRETSESS